MENADQNHIKKKLCYLLAKNNIIFTWSATEKSTKNEIINKSQDLYDDITSSNDGTFHTYNVVPPYFHNGVMHILAEEKPEVVWKLKTKDNE